MRDGPREDELDDRLAGALAPVRRSLLNFDLSPAPSRYLLRREREGEGVKVKVEEGATYRCT